MCFKLVDEALGRLAPNGNGRLAPKNVAEASLRSYYSEVECKQWKYPKLQTLTLMRLMFYSSSIFHILKLEGFIQF